MFYTIVGTGLAFGLFSIPKIVRMVRAGRKVYTWYGRASHRDDPFIT